jgi:hypothetical protein
MCDVINNEDLERYAKVGFSGDCGDGVDNAVRDLATELLEARRLARCAKQIEAERKADMRGNPIATLDLFATWIGYYAMLTEHLTPHEKQ